MRVGAKERAEARAVAEMPGSFAECWREIQDLRAEVERLRGIVQADIEEKAEARGEAERLRAALTDLVAWFDDEPDSGMIDELRRARLALRASPSPGTTQEGT